MKKILPAALGAVVLAAVISLVSVWGGSGPRPAANAGGAGGEELPSTCNGYPVTIYAVEKGAEYNATEGNDVIVQGVGTIIHGSGGYDLRCSTEGEVMSLSTPNKEDMNLSQDEVEQLIADVFGEPVETPYEP